MPAVATSPATVGIIVNPHAGKDIRRLVSAAGQTSDAVKISIVRRVAAGAIEQGAQRVLISSDTHHLAERAVEGLPGDVVEFVESPLTGSHLDTIAAARSMREIASRVASLSTSPAATAVFTRVRSSARTSPSSTRKSARKRA